MTTNTNPASRTRARLLKVGAVAVAAVVLVAAIGLWWFFRDDAPDEVSLDSAIESIDSVEASTQSTTVVNDAVGSVDISGTWVVDTDTGDFDYESATGSFVGFRIEEELNGIGSTTAVGRTGDVSGAIVIEGTTVTEVAFDVDMTTITTNSSQRDDNVQDALETGEFPSASFALTERIELGEPAAGGEAISVTAHGELTIHGVTQAVSFDLDAQLVDQTVVVVGSIGITFADYGVDVPSGGPVISVDDFGVLELQFLLTK